MQETVTVIEEKHIPEKAWYGRSDLIRVRLKNVWSVGPYAFSGCPNLTEIVCENGPAVICENAFSDCPNLASVFFSPSLRTIGESAFRGASIRDLSLPDELSLIGNSAFENCGRLESVRFPASVREIGASAFSDCISLKQIDLGSVSVLHDGCFANTAVESVFFSLSVSYIGRDAFSNCEALRMITLENAQVNVRGTSFIRCIHLTHAVFLHRDREEHRVLPRPLTQKDLTVSLDRFDRSIQDPVTALFRICFPFGLSDTAGSHCMSLIRSDPESCLRYFEEIRVRLNSGQRERIGAFLEPLLISFRAGN